MNNLTLREKAMAFGILLLIIIFCVYFFGIRTLNEHYAEYKVQLTELQERKAYLDQLKEDNQATQAEIEALNANIEEIELSFIDNLETEVLEQYVMSVFEDNGIPYLKNIGVEDQASITITNADGSTSENAVLCKRVTVTYVTTDGYLPTQYNLTPDLQNEDGTVNEAVASELTSQMGSEEFETFQGYSEFIAALKEIAGENEDCIKLSGITLESTAGYLTLTASVDFYGATLESRISIDDNKDGYTYWNGDKNVDTAGGFIGRPYIVENEDSRWNGLTIDESEVLGFQDRPFAPYFINAMFSQMLESQGLTLVTGEDSQVLNSSNSEAASADEFTQVSEG